MVIINGKSVGASVNIDGRFINISGKRIEITEDGKIRVDGKPIDELDSTATPVIKVEITGRVEKVEADCGEVNVIGDVGEVITTNGNVSCKSVLGNVNSKNGNVSCHTVMGDCQSYNGNIIKR